MLGKQLTKAAAGAAGGDPLYVDDIFSTYLYEGNGSTNRINNGIDLNGEGGLVWCKRRDTSGYNHHLYDTERGVTKYLSTNTTGGHYTTGTDFTSFNTDGFTLGTPQDIGSGLNGSPSGKKYVSWSFRKSPGFFDVVTWPGNGQVRNIPHNLGSTPGMIIVKRYQGGNSEWSVWHRSLGLNYQTRLRLNSNGNPQSGEAFWGDSNTAPNMNASTFSVGTSAEVNATGNNYVAYVFAHDDAQFGTDGDESIIKCGEYTGTGSEQFIDLGFEPQFLLIKRGNGSGDWKMFDNMRGWADTAQVRMFANTTDDDETSSGELTSTPTGFREPGTSNIVTNIYMAIRRPNKPPEAATDVFAIDTAGATSPTPPLFISGFPADFQMRFDTNSGNRIMHSRLQGTYSMQPAGTGYESSASSLVWDYQNGWSSDTSVESNVYSYMFRRAPGFMDVVYYEAASGDLTVNHNLGVTPEMVIVKGRNYTSIWNVWHSDLSAGTASTNHFIRLDATAPESSSANANFVSFSSTNFVVGNGRTSTNNTGVSGKYIAYLFASLDGISKVGTYDGSSSNINVNCGFAAGARFVLIKRIDATGDWCVFDTSRGINSGSNDPVMKIAGPAQDTGNNLVEPYGSGFTVVGGNSFVNNVNAGAKYIYLAIA